MASPDEMESLEETVADYLTLYFSEIWEAEGKTQDPNATRSFAVICFEENGENISFSAAGVSPGVTVGRDINDLLFKPFPAVLARASMDNLDEHIKRMAQGILSVRQTASQVGPKYLKKCIRKARNPDEFLALLNKAAQMEA